MPFLQWGYVCLARPSQPIRQDLNFTDTLSLESVLLSRVSLCEPTNADIRHPPHPYPHVPTQTSTMEARERRPQPKPERELPVEIDKEKLKKAFDFSHFDINAILRGAELTLVGGV